MKIHEISENISHTSKRLRDIERERGVKIGSAEWFKLWFSLPYLKESADKVYDILDNVECGPFDGGCVLVAQALQQIHGGDIVVLVNDKGIADHAAVKVGNNLIDFDGALPVKQFVKRFEDNEHTKIKSIRPIQKGDLPEAPRDKKLVPQLVNALTESTLSEGYRIQLEREKQIGEATEIEFVCVNPEFCDATDPKNQEALFQALKQVPGIIVYRQDFEVHNSMAAILKSTADRNTVKQIKQLAKKHNVGIDLENNVSNKFIDSLYTDSTPNLIDWYDSDYLNEGYNLQLERDPKMYVLHVTDTKTGKRTEVRGKSDYETTGYDANDKLHQLLDKLGKSANFAELMNGEVVTINPKHPHAAKAQVATDVAFNEETGAEMLKIFRTMHHDTAKNKEMDAFIKAHSWELRDFTPDMFPSEEEFFDYDDPFDRIIDIDYSHRVNLSAPIIVGPQFSDGKYSVIDGNHRAAAAQRMGKTIKGYFPVKKINEAEGLGLTIFDIDETLVRTTAQIKVVKDGKVVRSLTNQEFNNYKLQPGEEFDFGEFRNAEKFRKESEPIGPMIAKLKSILRNAGDSKIIMLTARADFDNKETFLDTFRDMGIDMSRVHVHRAGNLGGSPAQNKAVWIRKYLDTGKYARVRLYDDAMSNIRMFNEIAKDYPDIKFYPYLVTHDGSVKTVRESNPFTDARMNAIKAGKKEFTVKGKTYPVTGDTSDEEEAIANENFADGKKKGKSRPGRVKRAGASCKGSVSELRRKAKKYGGEKGKMYHWCANMKAGKDK